jgi:hypothetical protein
LDRQIPAPVAPVAPVERFSVDDILNPLPPYYTSVETPHVHSPSRVPVCTFTRSINDRLYGETAMLIELPEPEEISTPNCDITPFRGKDLENAWKGLDSIRGLSDRELW